MPIIILVALFCFPATAYAYIGPGLGVGTIGVVFGVLSSILLTLVAIIWYPIKRLIKKLKRGKHDRSV